jgi:hypothetical protein
MEPESYDPLKSAEGLVEQGSFNEGEAPILITRIAVPESNVALSQQPPTIFPQEKSLGRIAYEGSRAVTEKMSPKDDWWSSLSTAEKNAWEGAADAITDAVMKESTAITMSHLEKTDASITRLKAAVCDMVEKLSLEKARADSAEAYIANLCSAASVDSSQFPAWVFRKACPYESDKARDALIESARSIVEDNLSWGKECRCEGTVQTAQEWLDAYGAQKGKP